MATDNSDPAFPQTFRADGDSSWAYGLGGMSLRDYFAAKAMAAASPPLMLNDEDCALFAWTAYRLADAMLAERAK